ncbi:hypothetical protein K8I31_10040 [bacterium]|nr:hypothetical protein [bacterium]
MSAKIKTYYLIEGAVALAIIVILVFVSILHFIKVQYHTRIAQVKRDLHDISLAMDAYNLQSPISVMTQVRFYKQNSWFEGISAKYTDEEFSQLPFGKIAMTGNKLLFKTQFQANDLEPFLDRQIKLLPVYEPSRDKREYSEYNIKLQLKEWDASTQAPGYFIGYQGMSSYPIRHSAFDVEYSPTNGLISKGIIITQTDSASVHSWEDIFLRLETFSSDKEKE